MKREEVENLVNKYGPIFQRDLGLEEILIRWHVHLEISDTDDTAAVTMLDPDGSCDIVVHYEVAYSKRDVLGTIYHELIHVLFHEFYGMYKKKELQKVHCIEEILVQKLERFFDKHFSKRIKV